MWLGVWCGMWVQAWDKCSGVAGVRDPQAAEAGQQTEMRRMVASLASKSQIINTARFSFLWRQQS